MQEKISLLPFNTFGIAAQARYFEELKTIHQLPKLKELPSFRSNRLILGGGSNVLFTKDFDGVVVHNNLKGMGIIHEDEQHVLMKVAAGEIWHDLVLYAIDKGYGGIENLSLIPGRVGASPMQNIGA